MRKYILSIGLAVATGFTLTSCEDAFGDFLDKEPSNELTEADTFSQWVTMEQFHFDTYNFLRNGFCRITNSWMDAATDLAETSYSTAGTRLSFNVGNYYASAGAGELSDTWELFYRGIRKCNKLLECIDEVPKNPQHSTEEYERYKSWYKGEARFFRAYFHWELFLRYGAIPVVTESLNPYADLVTGYVDRPTTKEMVVDFIIPELKAAEGLVMDYATSYEDGMQGRINKPVVRALLSRILLYMASDRYKAESGITMREAAEMAQSFINEYGANYGLYQGENLTNLQRLTNAVLYNAHTQKNNETIFYRNDTQVYWASIANDTPVGEGGNGGLCPSQNFVDMFDMADGSAPFSAYDKTGAPVYTNSKPTVNAASGYSESLPYANRDPRLAAYVLYQGTAWGNGVINVVPGGRDNPLGNANSTPTGYYLRKFMPENILEDNHTKSAYRNWIYIRYAEILLNYAEALNEVSFDNKATVCGLLDQIRHRAGITGNVADRTDLNSQEALRNFIRKERTVELAFEDHRAWDVRRWNVATEALGRDIYGVDVANANGTYTYTRKVAQKRVFQDKMYLYPIPESEEWKTGIENNPGWTNN